MILLETYRNRSDKRNNLLEGFSSTDRSLVLQYSDQELSQRYRRVVYRLASMSIFNGFQVPIQMLKEMEKSPDDTIFDLVCHFLEFGSYNPDKNTPSRELQQEVVHFSRIVDLDTVDSVFKNKRLANSSLLPVSLKLILEFLTLARSRHLQWGKTLQVPRPSAKKMVSRELSVNETMLTRGKESDFLLVVSSSQKRKRVKFLKLFSESLSYLTPTEAIMAVSIYHLEEMEAEGITIAYLGILPDDRDVILDWAPIKIQENMEDLDFCLRTFPVFQIKEHGTAVHQGYSKTFLNGRMTACWHNDGLFIDLPDLPRIRLVEPKVEGEIFENKITNFASKFAKEHPDVISLECGHLHLDRKWDIDQEVGLSIGNKICLAYDEIKLPSPFLTPMLDDDHVTIATKPVDYEKFFTSMIPGRKYELIPECSPYIRVIICYLYNKVKKTMSGNLVFQGKNLYYLDDTLKVELFEDFDGECITGCIFFECALLVYRSFREEIRAFFDDAGLGMAHAKINSFWNSDGEHDHKVELVKEYFDAFLGFTDPRRSNPDFCDFMERLLENRSVKTHLNVLEDYYEVQQTKVSKFIRILDLPIKLLTVSFNSHTQRIVVL